MNRLADRIGRLVDGQYVRGTPGAVQDHWHTRPAADGQIVIQGGGRFEPGDGWYREKVVGTRKSNGQLVDVSSFSIVTGRDQKRYHVQAMRYADGEWTAYQKEHSGGGNAYKGGWREDFTTANIDTGWSEQFIKDARWVASAVANHRHVPAELPPMPQKQ